MFNDLLLSLINIKAKSVQLQLLYNNLKTVVLDAIPTV